MAVSTLRHAVSWVCERDRALHERLSRERAVPLAGLLRFALWVVRSFVIVVVMTTVIMASLWLAAFILLPLLQWLGRILLSFGIDVSTWPGAGVHAFNAVVHSPQVGALFSVFADPRGFLSMMVVLAIAVVLSWPRR